jgi:hypothetical protein
VQVVHEERERGVVRDRTDELGDGVRAAAERLVPRGHVGRDAIGGGERRVERDERGGGPGGHPGRA